MIGIFTTNHTNTTNLYSGCSLLFVLVCVGSWLILFGENFS